MKETITHRCNELLDYNKNPSNTPVAIQFKSKGFPYRERGKRVWKLRYLETDEEDWDIRFMIDICEIAHCPFCGVRLQE